MRWLLIPALALGLTTGGDTDAPETVPVHLDVTVTDTRGRASNALGPSDFHVTDGGSAIPVVSARFVAQQANGAGRVFAVFLDEYHVDAESAARIREQLTAFINADDRADDQWLVVKPLDSLLTLQLTTDRTIALEAVASFVGRRGDYEPRNAFERDLVAGDPARIDTVRAQIAVSAIHALATHLMRVPESRKALIIVSEGFVPRPSRRGESVLPTIDAVVRAANRANVVIYPMNPGAPEPPGADREMLARLAQETDGRMLGAGATDGLSRVSADMSGYYLLTVQGRADGQFHPLTVRVGKPGLDVRTRRGYWALSADEVARARLAAAPPPPPPPVLPPLRASRMIRPWFGQARGEAGRTRLTVVWEAAPTSTAQRGTLLPPSRLELKAVTLDGTQVFAGVVAASTRGGSPVATRATFDAPPGRLRLEMSIQDAAARVIDTDVREVIVSPLNGPIAFGTPSVFRARTAREFNALAGDADATPAVGREFSRDERLLVRLPLYGADSVAVGATLTSRSGQAMRTLPVARQSATGEYAVDLPLAGLAVGQYAIVLTAASGDDKVREAIDFRVTP